MPESEVPTEILSDDSWADGVDYRLLKLEKEGKTLKIGVVVGLGAGAAGIGMALILGKTVAKLAEGMGQIGQLTQAMMVQLNGPIVQRPQDMGNQKGSPMPTPEDMPAPSGEGSVRSFLSPRGTIDDESIRSGDETLEAVGGPESSVPDWAKEAMAAEHVDLNGTAPGAVAEVLPDPDAVPAPSAEGSVRSVVAPRIPPANG